MWKEGKWELMNFCSVNSAMVYKKSCWLITGQSPSVLGRQDLRATGVGPVATTTFIFLNLGNTTAVLMFSITTAGLNNMTVWQIFYFSMPLYILHFHMSFFPFSLLPLGVMDSGIKIILVSNVGVHGMNDNRLSI